MRRLPASIARLAALAVCFALTAAHGAQTRVAVAANFAATVRALAEAFETRSEHQVLITAGSSGLLYAQIQSGAPFDILLSADQLRAQQLVSDGRAQAHDRFTYAIGRLVLWSAQPRHVDDASLQALGSQSFRWLAVSEPRIAPYGAAAHEVLTKLNLLPQLRERIVTGQNVAQTFAMAQTGNAEYALVALAQALSFDGPASWSLVPQSLHAPIRQDAVLLDAARDNPAARAFFEYLQSASARELIEAAGYETSIAHP